MIQAADWLSQIFQKIWLYGHVSHVSWWYGPVIWSILSGQNNSFPTKSWHNVKKATTPIWISMTYWMPSLTVHIFISWKIGEIMDIDKESLLWRVSDFVSQETADLYGLVIMAHGDTDGNICDANGQPFSVQRVVDAFCAGSSKHKVHEYIFLNTTHRPHSWAAYYDVLAWIGNTMGANKFWKWSKYEVFMVFWGGGNFLV